MTDYYRGVVTSIVACEGTFDVEFDDGTTSLGLSLDCLLPFQPYQVGEEVEVRLNEEEEEWMYGTIERVTHDKDRRIVCDVKVWEDDVVTSVQSRDIRRRVVFAFELGDPVLVLRSYVSHDKWYPGEIQGVNEDGTYFVRYTDGDVEDHVPDVQMKHHVEA